MGRYRPWLAAALALLVAGLGHAYLRRWRRAAMWFGWILGTALVWTFVLADPTAETPADMPAELLLPILVLYALSAADAFRIGRADVRHARTAEEVSVGRGDAIDDDPTCPHCGRSVDPDLDFCTWCTEPLPRDDGVDSG